jgi:hypothetical protein
MTQTIFLMPSSGNDCGCADDPLKKDAFLQPYGGAGITERGLHPITNAALHDLFPPERTAWKAFLAGLLRHATIESSRAWGHVISRPEAGDVAVVSSTGVKDLSKKLGLAYATTHLYYTIFKAIGLLLEVRGQNRASIILFPLFPYYLPANVLTQLALVKARTKDKQVHHLVEGILLHRSRLARREPGKQQESPCSVQQEATLQQIQTLQQLLLSEGVADQDGRIATRIIAEMRSFANGNVVNSLMTDIIEEEQQQQRAHRDAHAEEAIYAESTKDFLSSAEQDTRLDTRQPHMADVPHSISSALATDRSQDSQHGLTQEHNQRQLASRTGDMTQTDTLLATNLLTAETSQDSSSHVSINGIGHFLSGIYTDSDPNDIFPTGQNSYTVTKTPSPTHILSTRNLRGLATALAWIVEGKTENVGAFVTLLKQYDPQVLLAAVIATLARKHAPCGMRPLDRPGGFCTKRCKEYQQTGIPDEIMAFMDSHQLLTYQEIDHLLYQQAQEQKIRNKRVPYTALLKGTADDRQHLPPPNRGTWMNRQIAEALALRIPQEAPDAKIVGVRDIQQGLNRVSVVDVQIAGALWPITSQEDWLDYIATICQLETLSTMEQ